MVISNLVENYSRNEKHYHSHHSICSLCYCLLLITGITLFQIVYIITKIRDKEMIYTCPRYLWPCIRWQFVIQASKSSIIFPRQLKISPASLISLKLLQNTVGIHTHFIVQMSFFNKQ